jgi:uncharacterized membrane protein (UPF0127 family)
MNRTAYLWMKLSTLHSLAAFPVRALLCIIVMMISSVSHATERSQVNEGCLIEFDNGSHIALPVARTAQAMKHGLMGQQDPGAGMVFVWQAAGIRGIWMKHTPAPLSAAWIAEDGEVQAVMDLEPMSIQKRSTMRPAIAVIEVPRGTFESLGVRAGGRIEQSTCMTLLHNR